MNLWTRRILILFSIGGGFGGLAFGIPMIYGANGLTNWVLVLPILSVFILGIYAGWRLGENEPRGLCLAQWFFAIQIPFVSSPYFGFGFVGGIGLRLGLNEHGILISSRLGSEAWISLWQGAPWAIAVNVAPLVLLIVCSRRSSNTQE
jgi:hypothetical protein